MLEFAAGAVAMGFLVAGGFFVRFWRRTGDRLFLAFALAFALLALNQLLAALLEAGDERTPFVYLLRVLAFVLIMLAVVDKNFAGRR